MRSESKLCLALEMQHWHFAVFNFLGWYLNVGRLSHRHIILKFIRTATRPGHTTPTLFGDGGIWNCCANSVYFKGSLSFPARPQDACLPSCPRVWDQLTRKPGCLNSIWGIEGSRRDSGWESLWNVQSGLSYLCLCGGLTSTSKQWEHTAPFPQIHKGWATPHQSPAFTTQDVGHTYSFLLWERCFLGHMSLTIDNHRILTTSMCGQP